jgi:hypothetical protein
VCCAEDHLTLSDAFDEALRSLPGELLNRA